MMKPEHDIMSGLTKSQSDELRKIIVEMVLATDLARHFDFLSHWQTALSTGQIGERFALSARCLILFLMQHATRAQTSRIPRVA